MRRLAVLCSIALLTALIPIAPHEVGGSPAAPVQKKFAKKYGGKVDGAVWGFVATSRDGQQIRFRYVARDLVLVDPETQEVIGKSVPITPKRSRVTFEKNSKFPATFEIVNVHREGHPMWNGTADYDGKSWTIRLTGLVN